MKLVDIKDPTITFLNKYNVENYTINHDGTVDVNGGVSLSGDIGLIPIKFGKVDGVFNCEGCKLKTLTGSPMIVTNDFICSQNLLSSLDGAPSEVGGNFICSYNKITSLHDIHKIIKKINKYFYCHKNPVIEQVLGTILIKDIKEIIIDNMDVKRILNKHLGQGRSGVISAQQELLDANLDEYAKL